MTHRHETYLCPFTGFGFKKIFGTESNKDLLVDFLNQLIGSEAGTIVDVEYITEQLGPAYGLRHADVNIHCKNQTGEVFIVELQRTKDSYVKDRMVHYSTFPILEQVLKDGWDYPLKTIYTIDILDFEYKKLVGAGKVIHHQVKLCNKQVRDETYEKLTYIYIDTPEFTKPLEECETRLDKWLYVLRNLADLTSRPAKLKGKIFKKLFEVAEVANYGDEEYGSYFSSLKTYRDFNNCLRTSYEEGIRQGIANARERSRD